MTSTRAPRTPRSCGSGATILDEDRVICEAVQRNLESGVYDTGVLSPRHEQGVAAFQRWLRESLAD